MSDNKDCSVEGCNRMSKPRGEWCQKHYQRNRRHGDPTFQKKYETTEESFLARRAIEGDCIVWTGFIAPNGYARVGFRGKVWLAHRYAWLRVHGEIPKGMDVDHICRNRKCVKVEHLRLTTRAQNLQNRQIESRQADSGYRGVFMNSRGKWSGAVTHAGVRYETASYSTIEEARDAVIAKRVELYTHNEDDRAYIAAKDAS